MDGWIVCSRTAHPSFCPFATAGQYRARRLKSGALMKTYFGDFLNRRGGDEE